MIGTISKALTVACGLAVIASVAMAGVPDATQSTTDGDLMLGNARGFHIVTGLPNVRATVGDGYLVTVRDIGGTPLAGVTVSMLFSGSGIQVHSTQTSGQVANCGLNTLSKVTDAGGQVIFFPGTRGINSSATANVQIRANNVLLTTIRFRSLDLVATGGGGSSAVNVADLNQFRTFFSGGTNLAADYASEGTSANKVDVSDLNLFRTEFLCGSSGAPAPCSLTECP